MKALKGSLDVNGGIRYQGCANDGWSRVKQRHHTNLGVKLGEVEIMTPFQGEPKAWKQAAVRENKHRQTELRSWCLSIQPHTRSVVPESLACLCNATFVATQCTR